MAIASPSEQSRWRKKAYKLAEQQQDVVLALSLLLEINETKIAIQMAIS